MKFSLSKKVILLVVCIVAIISVLAIVICNRGIYNVIEKQYEQRSIDITRLVAAEIDSERLTNVKNAVVEIYKNADNKVMSDKWGTAEFDAYVSQYKSIYDTDDYKTLLADLQKMQDVLSVDCLYLVWVDVERECYIYLVDAAHEDACPIGCIDPLFPGDEDVLANPANGMKPNITNTPEYGWLIATGMPIYNDKGELIAFSSVDISMNELTSLQYRVLLYIVLAFMVVTALVGLIGLLLVNRIIVKPINKLSKAAAQYTHNSNVFSNLNMSRSDEIGMLADSMAHMEQDINSYIGDLKKTTNDLISAREHAEEMYIAANVDALTKVRNKRAFDIETQRLDKSTNPYGLIMVDMNGLKAVNDTYGHEKGDISIKTVCKITCHTFKHSPVYRIGGDEFVVILENSDYEDCDSLLQTLKDKFIQTSKDESLQPWERVSAAVGCATFDPGTEESAQSVLRRADEAMYKNKHEWNKSY